MKKIRIDFWCNQELTFVWKLLMKIKEKRINAKHLDDALYSFNVIWSLWNYSDNAHQNETTLINALHLAERYASPKLKKPNEIVSEPCDLWNWVKFIHSFNFHINVTF